MSATVSRIADTKGGTYASEETLIHENEFTMNDTYTGKRDNPHSVERFHLEHGTQT